MIKITAACGGDVIKFAGDALIVLWVDAPKSVLTCVAASHNHGKPLPLTHTHDICAVPCAICSRHRACECAMELQDVLHNAQVIAIIFTPHIARLSSPYSRVKTSRTHGNIRKHTVD